jgi:hypothetical protein
MDEGQIDVEAVEGEAYSLLSSVPEYVWDGESLPVPVESIVENVLGLKVRHAHDMTAAPGCDQLHLMTLSGLLLTNLGEIWVNADEAEKWPGRGRFTIGHEVGHFLLHQDERPGIFCRTGDIVEDEEPDQSLTMKPQPESEADAFAAAMLMPEHLVRAHRSTHGRDVEKLRGMFGCSYKAMNRRLNGVATSRT